MLTFATSSGAYVALLLIGVIGAAIGVSMAKKRGRNSTIWGIACFLFPLLGIIVLAIAGTTEAKKREDIQRYVTATAAVPVASAAEWRPDPSGRHEFRYWNGSGWSDSVADHGVQSTDPMTPASAAPGEWRPDPSGRHEYRFWDGSAWSENVSDHGQSAIDPLTAPEPHQEYLPVADGTKICPDCAEEIKAAARVCRFCGHQFEPASEAGDLVGAGVQGGDGSND